MPLAATPCGAPGLSAAARNPRFWTFLHSLYARAREAEWELGTLATDKYRSSLTTSRNHYAAAHVIA
jgi:hypothetical protein